MSPKEGGKNSTWLGKRRKKLNLIWQKAEKTRKKPLGFGRKKAEKPGKNRFWTGFFRRLGKNTLFPSKTRTLHEAKASFQMPESRLRLPTNVWWHLLDELLHVRPTAPLQFANNPYYCFQLNLTTLSTAAINVHHRQPASGFSYHIWYKNIQGLIKCCNLP